MKRSITSACSGHFLQGPGAHRPPHCHLGPEAGGDGTYSGKLVLYGHTPRKSFYQPGDTCKAIIAGRAAAAEAAASALTPVVARNKDRHGHRRNKPGGPVYQLRQVEYGKVTGVSF